MKDRPDVTTDHQPEGRRGLTDSYVDDPYDYLHLNVTPEQELLEELDGFNPVRANLPNLDDPETSEYIERYRAERPWLGEVAEADVAVRKVFAALDSGRGHLVERHEGYGGDEAQHRRVTELVDPAGSESNHRCGTEATRIHDPAAFAVAFTRGLENPRLRAVLDRQERGDRPDRVDVPIAELLGEDGHEMCSGYRLLGPRRERDEWAQATDAEREQQNLNPPRAEAIDSFEGGVVRFIFGWNKDDGHYEVKTMFPVLEEEMDG